MTEVRFQAELITIQVLDNRTVVTLEGTSTITVGDISAHKVVIPNLKDLPLGRVIIELLKVRPHTYQELKQETIKLGFAKGSASSAISKFKRSGMIFKNEAGYWELKK